MLNFARLQVLKCKENHIKNVLEEAQAQLATVMQNPETYKTVVEKLLLQGLLQLVEDVSKTATSSFVITSYAPCLFYFT